jgi:hypothetical protein
MFVAGGGGKGGENPLAGKVLYTRRAKALPIE